MTPASEEVKGMSATRFAAPVVSLAIILCLSAGAFAESVDLLAGISDSNVGAWGTGTAKLVKTGGHKGAPAVEVTSVSYHEGGYVALPTPVDLTPYLAGGASLSVWARISSSGGGPGGGFGGFGGPRGGFGGPGGGFGGPGGGGMPALPGMPGSTGPLTLPQPGGGGEGAPGGGGGGGLPGLPTMPGFQMPQMPGRQGAAPDNGLSRWAQFPGMGFPGMGGEGGMGLPPMLTPGGEGGGMGMPGMEGGGMGMPGMEGGMGGPGGFGGFGSWRRRRSSSSKPLDAVRVVLVTNKGQMDAGGFTLSKLTNKDGEWYEIRVPLTEMKSRGVTAGAMLNGIIVTGNSKGTLTVGPMQITQQ